MSIILTRIELHLIFKHLGLSGQYPAAMESCMIHNMIIHWGHYRPMSGVMLWFGLGLVICSRSKNRMSKHKRFAE